MVVVFLGVSARVVCFLFGEKGRKQIECPVFFFRVRVNESR